MAGGLRTLAGSKGRARLVEGGGGVVLRKSGVGLVGSARENVERRVDGNLKMPAFRGVVRILLR